MCLPTKGEGFGLPIIEAQACGIPVVTTATTTGPELCKTGWLIDVDADDKHWLGTGVFRLEPRPSKILTALEEAYDGCQIEASHDSVTKAMATMYVRPYSWDAVWTKYWMPLLKEMESRLDRN
jgi:glycosyltransferase involved in cell wall biosynthesis